MNLAANKAPIHQFLFGGNPAPLPPHHHPGADYRVFKRMFDPFPPKFSQCVKNPEMCISGLFSNKSEIAVENVALNSKLLIGSIIYYLS